jgi:hypothetical protein
MKNKSEKDYLLFDKYGKILGITRNLYNIFFEKSDLSLESINKSGFI